MLSSQKIVDVILEKVAKENEEELSSSDKVNLGIVGGSLAAPWLGRIGEKKITKDPYYNLDIPRMSSKELGTLAKPGDVFLTSTREGAGFYKKPQLAITGSEFYHAEPVLHAGKQPITTEAGAFSRHTTETPEDLLRKKRGTPLSQRISTEGLGTYEDAVLLRPKKKLTSEQQKKMQQMLVSGAKKEYGSGLAARAYLRDIFMPKIKKVTDRVAPKGPLCVGEMCSSLPAGSLESLTGEKITAGKHSKSVLPADFLRSDSPYEAVGASLKNPKALTSKAQRALRRGLARGGIGLGLAGTGLLAYNEPEALLGIAAGATAPIGARALLDQAMRTAPSQMPEKSLKRKLLEHIQKQVHKSKGVDTILPPVPWMLGELSDIKAMRRAAQEAGEKFVMDPQSKRYIKNFLKHTAGTAAVAGLGTYGLAKLIGRHLNKDNNKTK